MWMAGAKSVGIVLVTRLFDLIAQRVSMFRGRSRCRPKVFGATWKSCNHNEAVPLLGVSTNTNEWRKTMHAKYAIFGMVASFALGATALEGLRAQTKAPAFGIVEVLVSDKEAYAKEFLPPITKTVSGSGGKFLAVGGKTVPLTGAPPAGRVVIVQWESMDQLQSWWDSQATKDASTIGNKYASFRIFAVEGAKP
jgi:uncharacterized protein (DUF1330 family)